MTIRLLHFSDLHLDRAFAAMGCQGDLARRRRQGLREALTAAGRLAAEQGCIAVTIGGDLYEHERAGVDTGDSRGIENRVRRRSLEHEQC